MGASLPHPYEGRHALAWLRSVKPNCDLGQEDLRLAATNKSTAPFIRGCPIRTLREVTDDKEVYLGDCGITRLGSQLKCVPGEHAEDE